MASLNYAESYAQALANTYPYTLNFGRLWSTPNNGRYRWGDNGKTIYLPRITVTGSVDADRDAVAQARRNYDNSWEPKRLRRQRQWNTLVHPKDVEQTAMTTTIANITQVYNETQKFPETDAYTVSQIYKLWTSTDPEDATKTAMTADTTAPTAANVLTIFDNAMTAMDNAGVYGARILYVTPVVRRLIENASGISRSVNVQQNNRKIDRTISRIEEVEIVTVRPELMKTYYDFTVGWVPADNAAQVNMLLVDPSAIISVVSYETVLLDPPSAGTAGNWHYFEARDEDVFIINQKQKGIWFNVTAATGTYTAVESPTGNPSASGYFEKSGDYYYASKDTTVNSSKTYYTKS